MNQFNAVVLPCVRAAKRSLLILTGDSRTRGSPVDSVELTADVVEGAGRGRNKAFVGEVGRRREHHNASRRPPSVAAGDAATAPPHSLDEAWPLELGASLAGLAWGCRNRGVPQQWGAGLADEVRVVVTVEGGGCLRRAGHAMSTARYIACRNGR